MSFGRTLRKLVPSAVLIESDEIDHFYAWQFTANSQLVTIVWLADTNKLQFTIGPLIDVRNSVLAGAMRETDQLLRASEKDESNDDASQSLRYLTISEVVSGDEARDLAMLKRLLSYTDLDFISRAE